MAEISAFRTSPLERTGIDKLDDGRLEVPAGFHRQFAFEPGFQFAFCEDLTRAVPDFNLHGRIIRRFF